MKQLVVLGVLALGAWGRIEAQTPIDALESDLQQAQAQHDSAASQEMTTFLSTLDSASQSPSLALDLYKKAGGNLPDAAPVRSRYEYETPTEKAQRQALDVTNYTSVANVIQIHCALMKNAALLATTPQAAGVQEGWMDWLKATALIYPQLAGHRALKEVPMKKSVISSYLNFNGWGDSDQGGWKVSDLPQLYHDLVLTPLRATPTQATMDAWNTYIAMLQADEPDKEKWAQEEPAYDFDRDCDDYAMQPNMDKLQALDEIIKANPTSDHLDDWIKRLQALIDSYRHGGTATGLAPGATPGTPSSAAPGPIPAATPGTPSSAAATSTPSPPPWLLAPAAHAATPAATPTPTPAPPASGTGSPVPAPAAP